MSKWSVAGAVWRGTNRASERISGRAADAADMHAAERVSRSVRRRGYLAPGDGPPPPGSDLLDYRGVLPYGELMAASDRGEDAVDLGLAVDVERNTVGRPFALPLSRFLQHMAVIAPPGKGKTYGVIAPLVVRFLRAGASVVVLDVTGDLANQIQEYLQQTPASSPTPVRWLHWSTHPNHGRHRWNPLDGIRADDIIATEGLKAAVVGDRPPDPRHQDFHDRDTRIFGGLLMVAMSTIGSPTMTDVAELAASPAALRRACAVAPRHVASIVGDLLGPDGDSLWGLRNKLEPFLDPAVRAVTDQSDFSTRDVINDPTLLIVGAELELRQRARVASALLVNSLVATLQGRYGRDGRPLLLVLDEAPVLAERLDLASILATARGARCGVVLAAQHVTQFGDDNARSALLDSCDTMMILGGSTEPSVRMFQGRLGQREVRRTSFGFDGRGATARNVRTESTGELVETIGARELYDPPFGLYTAFVHSRTIGARPIVLDLTRGRVTS